MEKKLDTLEAVPSADLSYESPALIAIGNACDVIMGVPGVGIDGPNGYTDPDFEFAADE